MYHQMHMCRMLLWLYAFSKQDSKPKQIQQRVQKSIPYKRRNTREASGSPKKVSVRAIFTISAWDWSSKSDCSRRPEISNKKESYVIWRGLPSWMDIRRLPARLESQKKKKKFIHVRTYKKKKECSQYFSKENYEDVQERECKHTLFAQWWKEFTWSK